MLQPSDTIKGIASMPASLGMSPRSIVPKQPAPLIQPGHSPFVLFYPSRSGDMPLSEAFDLPGYRFDGLQHHLDGGGGGDRPFPIPPIFDKGPAIESRVNLFRIFICSCWRRSPPQLEHIDGLMNDGMEAILVNHIGAYWPPGPAEIRVAAQTNILTAHLVVSLSRIASKDALSR